jgi:hypothetical protein
MSYKKFLFLTATGGNRKGKRKSRLPRTFYLLVKISTTHSAFYVIYIHGFIYIS